MSQLPQYTKARTNFSGSLTNEEKLVKKWQQGSEKLLIYLNRLAITPFVEDRIEINHNNIRKLGQDLTDYLATMHFQILPLISKKLAIKKNVLEEIMHDLDYFLDFVDKYSSPKSNLEEFKENLSNFLDKLWTRMNLEDKIVNSYLHTVKNGIPENKGSCTNKENNNKNTRIKSP